MKYAIAVFALFIGFYVQAQDEDQKGILSAVLHQYYKNERPVIKGRGSQYLFFYCTRTNNNPEIFETVNAMKLPKETVSDIRKQVAQNVSPEDWSAELEAIFASDKTKLQMKVNECLSVEQYQEKRARLNLNNQRLLILYKPVFFENKTKALVKLVFYRTIEHNSGSVLLLEKTDKGWTIKDNLNPWQT